MSFPLNEADAAAASQPASPTVSTNSPSPPNNNNANNKDEVDESIDIDDDIEVARHELFLSIDPVPEPHIITTSIIEFNKIYVSLLVNPDGNVRPKDANHVSVFIQLEKDAFPAPRTYGWESFMHMRFFAINKDPSKTFTNVTSCRWNESSTSWGFPQFYERKKLFNPDNGFVVDGKVTFRAIIVGVTGLSLTWGHFSKYSSRLATGFIGLQNQGATCYMNSVLQTLFHTNALRRAVFQMPTERDDRTKSVAYALQRLFFAMQTEDNAASTTELTKSFGWTDADSFMQHDIQEFSRVLIDKIEEKMNNTPVAGFVPNLLSGTTRSFIKCTEVEFESSHEGTFYDLQLNVSGCPTLEDALKRYIEVELMDGDNKYRAEGFGLQPAKRGTIFKKMPPILHLHLVRFQFSPEYMDYVKVNDRMSFTDRLDLTPFMETPTPGGDTYILHSVLVHSGGSHHGHYIVYVRPVPTGPWLEFNDEQVRKVSATTAMDRNFGSDVKGVQYGSSAYMLVYVRENMISDLLRPADLEDIPLTLRDRIHEEQKEDERARHERADMLNNINIDLITENYLKSRTVPDFAALLTDKDPNVIQMVLRLDMTVHQMMEKIEEKTGIPVNQQLLTPLFRRTNLYQLRAPLVSTSTTTLKEASAYLKSSRWKILLEVNEPDTPQRHFAYVKYFDPATGTLSFGGRRELPVDSQYSFLLQNEPEGSVLFVDSSLDPENLLPTAVINETSVIIQRPWSEGQTNFPSYVSDLKNRVTMTFIPKPKKEVEEFGEKVTKAKATEEGPTIASTSSTITTSSSTTTTSSSSTNADQTVPMQQDPPAVVSGADAKEKEKEKEKSKDGDDDKEEKYKDKFTLVLDCRMSYDEVARRVAEKVGSPHPCNIQFSHALSYSGDPGSTITYYSSKLMAQTLDTMRLNYHNYATTLFFEVLPIPVEVLQQDKVRIQPKYLDHATMTVKYLDIFVDKTALVGEILQEAAKQLPVPPTRPLRMLTERMHQILDVLKDDDHVNNMVPWSTFRIEEIPADQEGLTLGVNANGRMLVNVEHICRDIYRTHGLPFLFVAHEGELVSALRTRLSEYMRLPVTTTSKWRFGYKMDKIFRALDDESPLSFAVINPITSNPVLIFDHPDTAAKRYKREKAVKIYN